MSGHPAGVTYRKSETYNPNEYRVYHDGVLVGSVTKFQMGAGQFGATWMATSPQHGPSTRFPSRDAAAAWLVQQTRT